MDGFPNFFMIFGPNTATGHSSVVMAAENMVNYSLKFISLILNGEAHTVDVTRAAEQSYTAEIQRALKNSVWQSGCSSWYFTKDGWNPTVYPFSQIDFWRRCAFPTWSYWDIQYTRKGISTMWWRRAIRVSVTVLSIVGVYRVRQMGLGMRYLQRMLMECINRSLVRVVQALKLGKILVDFLSNKGVGQLTR